MTAPHRPDPDDLASALLDGLLDADEAEEARRDPAVVARVAALAAARDALATPPPPPDAAGRERAISAAMSAFDAETSATDDDATATDASPSAPPRTFEHSTPLPRRASARAGGRGPGRRAAPSEHWARWLGVAAAVVLVVAGVSLLARGDGSGDEDTAAEDTSSGEGGAGSEAEAPAEADDDDARDEAGESADESTDGRLASGDVLDLGVAESPDALADRALSTLAAERGLADVPATEPEAADAPGTTDAVPGNEGQDGAAAERASEPLACPTGEATATARGGSVDLRARARLDGQPVEVWVIDVGGSLTVLAVDANCAVILDRPLPG